MPTKKPDWKLCPALEVFRKQLNEIDPDRSKVSDGTVGDTSHKAKKSDHNPDPDDGYLVKAIDITDNKERGINADILYEALVKGADPRAKYIINEGFITKQGTNLQQKKKYTGVNAHRHHLHLSVFSGKLARSTKKWDLSVLEEHYKKNPVGLPVAKIEEPKENGGSEVKETVEKRTVGGKETTEITSKNEQDVNIPVKEEERIPYNDKGLGQTLKDDAKVLAPSNLGLQVTDVIAQVTGLPEMLVRIVGIIAIAGLIAAAIWLFYRFISYIVHEWRESKRIENKNLINSNPNLKDLLSPEEWEALQKMEAKDVREKLIGQKVVSIPKEE